MMFKRNDWLSPPADDQSLCGKPQNPGLDAASKVALFGYVFVEAIVIVIFVWKTLARH
ncbi:MAG TPA: hypothetical protein VFF39_19450 [Verrucomicrobiae bacterium]|nr:hypothetical protein [Verrucomicrobiae bacterium]